MVSHTQSQSTIQTYVHYTQVHDTQDKSARLLQLGCCMTLHELFVYLFCTFATASFDVLCHKHYTWFMLPHYPRGHADYVGRRGQDFRLLLFVCLSVCPQHNSKTNDPKVFKLCIGNDLGMYCTWYGFGLKGQRSTLGFGLTAILRGFELYECLPVWRILLRVLKPRLYLATCCRAAYFESVH